MHMFLHRGLYFSTDLLLSSTYLRGRKPSCPQTVVTYEEHETRNRYGPLYECRAGTLGEPDKELLASGMLSTS